MYQFYYADHTDRKRPEYHQKISDVFHVTAVRPTMWEEHCLECSAPLCFQNCLHYVPRSDGRCKRFENGIEVFANPNGCCGQAIRIRFRKWANMMSIIFPAMLTISEAQVLTDKIDGQGKKLEKISHGHLPVKAKWEYIRTTEYLRRRKLRSISGLDNKPDAFVFHGYSFESVSFRLIMEIYDSHTPVFKTSFMLQPGENLHVLDKSALTSACYTDNYLVKIYPENDLEAELDILWCDFVQGTPIVSDSPAKLVKCVVWDLDNTLWNGTLIETEDNSSLRLKDGVLETIKALDERGILQSIASKNDYDMAWPVVESLGMSEFFLYPQIHWNAKSGSIEQIANDLNIGVDTFALIDDSRFEREQVRSVLPQVRTYDITELDKLLSFPEFNTMITEESKKRRSMYRAEEKRTQLKENDNMDTIDFLKKCNLSVELFNPVTEAELTRCYELVLRTNQLNMSGRKYNQAEFEAVINKSDHKNVAFSCKDDFGEYGIVGFGQYCVVDKRVVFSEFAMSCRVVGKYVESALFAFILERELCGNGSFKVRKTKKNILLRNTLENIGFMPLKDSDDEVEYIFETNLKEKNLIKVIERDAQNG